MGTVSMAWNDTRHHRYGDILLQSFTLRSLHPVQHTPVVLDTPHHGGLAFMPAVHTSWISEDSRISLSVILRRFARICLVVFSSVIQT